jgi:glycosyltransferase involved in cell wall biosynthesis
VRVLLLAPGLGEIGGGNALSAYAAQALAEYHRVTVLVWSERSLAEADEVYGTSLREMDIEIVAVPAGWRWLCSKLPFSHHLLCLHLSMRKARQIAGRFDACVSMMNEVDLGRRCVQYIHFPWSYLPRPDAPPGWNTHPLLRSLLWLYYAVCKRISGYRLRGMRGNLSLANSAWTAAHLGAVGAQSAAVLYPCNLDRYEQVAWEDRKDQIVCLGRFCQEKRLEVVIEIVRKVRLRRPQLRLLLVGSSRLDQPYTERIKRLAAGEEWITFCEDLPRPQLVELLSQQRYGLHGMIDEHFGMAVAELVQAGCIPFCHDSGGPREIVAGESALLYSDVDAAAEKIVRVLDDPAEQARLRAVLARQGQRFSYGAFGDGLLRAVEESTSIQPNETSRPF